MTSPPHRTGDGGEDIERLLRELAPGVLADLIRRYGGFATCEDAVQEALLAASRQWPAQGLPENPGGWLAGVASRRRIEMLRRDTARWNRERAAAALEPRVVDPAPGADDTLDLLTMCCHPALTTPSQIALTLRAVGGLTTSEIARAFLVPATTIGQRISRAKARIKASREDFTMPAPAQRSQRLGTVLHVLYLIFNEGYTASSGTSLHRVELTAEAIRLVRRMRAGLTAHDGVASGEVNGLLALMLLTDARRPARTTVDGALIPLAEQDRRRWDRAAVAEGTALIAETLRSSPIGPYQIQAAIAAVHDEAAHAADTDWPQILALYDVLVAIAPGPMVTLNRIVALAMVDGAEAGLAELDLVADPSLAAHHRLAAVRGHLLERAGQTEAAARNYLLAADRTFSVPERAYLLGRAARLEMSGS